VTRLRGSGLLIFTAYPPEDNQRDRKCRSAGLQRAGPKGLSSTERRVSARLSKDLRDVAAPAGL